MRCLFMSESPAPGTNFMHHQCKKLGGICRGRHGCGESKIVSEKHWRRVEKKRAKGTWDDKRAIREHLFERSLETNSKHES